MGTAARVTFRITSAREVDAASASLISPRNASRCALTRAFAFQRHGLLVGDVGDAAHRSDGGAGLVEGDAALALQPVDTSVGPDHAVFDREPASLLEGTVNRVEQPCNV